LIVALAAQRVDDSRHAAQERRGDFWMYLRPTRRVSRRISHTITSASHAGIVVFLFKAARDVGKKLE